MATQITFGLTAYDPNPVDVVLSVSKETCDVVSSGTAAVNIEDYKTDDEGNPEYIQLKVNPEAIAFMMCFKDGNMTIEFKGNWSAFKAAKEAEAVVQREPTPEPTPEVTPEPVLEPVPEPIPEPISPEITPEPELEPEDLPAETELCMKVHCKEEDVDSIDVLLKAKDGVIEAVGGEGVYKVVHQTPSDNNSTEFVVDLNHPSGDKYVIRAKLRGDQITFLNTDLWDENNLDQYIQFYINDEARSADIKKEIEADPDNKIGILYKHGCYSEGTTFASVVSYFQHKDKDGNPITKLAPRPDSTRAKRQRLNREKAESSGKKGSGPPAGKDWSCGRVKWELPVEGRTYGDAGKLKIPDFSVAEKQKEQKKVGKLKWGGFDQQEPSSTALEERRRSSAATVKVGKLNTGLFGGGNTNNNNNPPPARKSWKKK